MPVFMAKNGTQRQSLTAEKVNGELTGRIVEVFRLSRAPDVFLEILAQHVNQKTGLHAIR